MIYIKKMVSQRESHSLKLLLCIFLYTYRIESAAQLAKLFRRIPVQFLHQADQPNSK